MPVLICLTFFLASGMGSMSSAHLIRAPRRPSLSNTDRGRTEYQGSAAACPASWSAESVSSGFGDGQRIRAALMDANRISKRVARTSSTAQTILRKVRNMCRFTQFYWQRVWNQNCCCCCKKNNSVKSVKHYGRQGHKKHFLGFVKVFQKHVRLFFPKICSALNLKFYNFKCTLM